VNGYGRWLGYLTVTAPTLLELPPEERVTRERIEAFCRVLAEIHTAGQPRSKAANLRMSDELYRLGFNLMDEADEAASERTKARDTLATHKNTG
jgi:hypothetical protein